MPRGKTGRGLERVHAGVDVERRAADCQFVRPEGCGTFKMECARLTQARALTCSGGCDGGELGGLEATRRSTEEEPWRP